MNWYKKAQQIIEDPKDKSYLEIGHAPLFKDIKTKNPNIMWAYINGQILTVPESNEVSDHNTAFEEEFEPSAHLSGRYDPRYKIISVNIPYNIMKQNRGVPNTIIRLLQQKFPKAEKIYVYH